MKYGVYRESWDGKQKKFTEVETIPLSDFQVSRLREANENDPGLLDVTKARNIFVVFDDSINPVVYSTSMSLSDVCLKFGLKAKPTMKICPVSLDRVSIAEFLYDSKNDDGKEAGDQIVKKMTGSLLDMSFLNTRDIVKFDEVFLFVFFSEFWFYSLKYYSQS